MSARARYCFPDLHPDRINKSQNHRTKNRGIRAEGGQIPLKKSPESKVWGEVLPTCARGSGPSERWAPADCQVAAGLGLANLPAQKLQFQFGRRGRLKSWGAGQGTHSQPAAGGPPRSTGYTRECNAGRYIAWRLTLHFISRRVSRPVNISKDHDSVVVVGELSFSFPLQNRPRTSAS